MAQLEREDTMKRLLLSSIAGALLASATIANAALIGVSGPNSNLGTGPAIIGAPSDVLDDLVFNTGMEGFNEAQDVVLPSAIGIDGGSIAAGTLVDSHMIFLNSRGGTALRHLNVVWTFDGVILGVMSDSGGTLEAASTSVLGAPTTNYTVTSSGTGPAAPFTARGLEANGGCTGNNDGYLLVSANQLCVSMYVTEPGDWIRVVTAAPIPVPASGLLLPVALGAIAVFRRKKRAAKC